MSQLLNTTSSSLPILPPSLRSRLTTLRGGDRDVVRRTLVHLWDRWYPLGSSLRPEVAPLSFLFLIPRVLTRLELNIYELSVLSAIYLHSHGGKYPVVRDQIMPYFTKQTYHNNIIRLKKLGLISRSNRDHTGHHPKPPALYSPQPRYIFITQVGVNALYKAEKLLKSEIKRTYADHVFEDNKNPDSMAGV